VPRLVREGFSGLIYCTSGTAHLLRILLEDAVSLYLRDLEYENLRRERAGKPLMLTRNPPVVAVVMVENSKAYAQGGAPLHNPAPIRFLPEVSCAAPLTVTV
jgi:hypothetical protein